MWSSTFPALGCASHSWRNPRARPRRVPSNRRRVHPAMPRTTVPDVAGVPREPRAADGPVDFFTVPAATFRVLFVFIVLAHERRRVLHFNVTEHPTAGWTGRQRRETFPWNTAPRFLLRDGVSGDDFVRVVRSLTMERVLIAARSPWRNPFAERIVGSIRRECLDPVVVLNEAHLRRLQKSYSAYDHRTRTHLSLDRDSPGTREVEPPDRGEFVEIAAVGGIHHRNARRAA